MSILEDILAQNNPMFQRQERDPQDFFGLGGQDATQIADIMAQRAAQPQQTGPPMQSPFPDFDPGMVMDESGAMGGQQDGGGILGTLGGLAKKGAGFVTENPMGQYLGSIALARALGFKKNPLALTPMISNIQGQKLQREQLSQDKELRSRQIATAEERNVLLNRQLDVAQTNRRLDEQKEILPTILRGHLESGVEDDAELHRLATESIRNQLGIESTLSPAFIKGQKKRVINEDKANKLALATAELGLETAQMDSLMKAANLGADWTKVDPEIGAKIGAKRYREMVELNQRLKKAKVGLAERQYMMANLMTLGRDQQLTQIGPGGETQTIAAGISTPQNRVVNPAEFGIEGVAPITGLTPGQQASTILGLLNAKARLAGAGGSGLGDVLNDASTMLKMTNTIRNDLQETDTTWESKTPEMQAEDTIRFIGHLANRSLALPQTGTDPEFFAPQDDPFGPDWLYDDQVQVNRIAKPVMSIENTSAVMPWIMAVAARANIPVSMIQQQFEEAQKEELEAGTEVDMTVKAQNFRNRIRKEGL
jgi:hypothetical protein